jgi:GTP-binding protein YchF
MKLGIVGLPQSGKSTIFAALSGARGQKGEYGASGSGPRISTVTVLDERVDLLTKIYQPKKTTYAKIEYLLPSKMPALSPSKAEGGVLNQLRICDALLEVLRNFEGPGGSSPTTGQDFLRLEEEMVLSDLVVAEKRIERIELDRKRGKKEGEAEYSLLKSCRECLEGGEPLRNLPELASDPLLRGFTFLSAKPILVIVNNEDEDEELPEWDSRPQGIDPIVVRGRLEMEIASLSPEEAEEFREAYHIQESALDRVIKNSYQILNRISFFTVISDEVRAWSIDANSPALEAAGAVHSDMKKGFIRAEVLSFEDLKTHGSFQEAKKAGLVRLEGKEYAVKDGDIINFRFNV